MDGDIFLRIWGHWYGLLGIEMDQDVLGWTVMELDGLVWIGKSEDIMIWIRMDGHGFVCIEMD